MHSKLLLTALSLKNGPIECSAPVLDLLTLEYGTDSLFRNVCNYHYTLRNILEERMA
jgi:hypothetical protein